VVAQWLRCCATIRKVAGSIPDGVIGFSIDIKSFRSHYGPGVDSTCNRDEYQEHFLSGKGGRCVRLITYHHPVSSRNLGTLTSWNPLGHSRPVMGLLSLSQNCILHFSSPEDKNTFPFSMCFEFPVNISIVAAVLIIFCAFCVR
jgi:hypothetical protein